MATEAKTRRSVLKRAKKEQLKEERKKGAVTAHLKNYPTSPRKIRLVVDLIRGERVDKALNILKYQPQVGAKAVEKLLLSAMANWQEKNEEAAIEDAELYVKEIFVGGGRMLKRYQPAPQGRAHRIRKRSNHVTLTLDSLVDIPSVQVEEKEKAEKKKPQAKKESGSKKEDKATAKKAETSKKASAKKETAKKADPKKEEKKEGNK